MTDERRYQEDEVAEIFRAAAAPREEVAPRRAPSPADPADGLTLAELQAIGREAGMEPERIAEAAASLELRRGALPGRRHLGMPISVGRVVELPRAPTDHEWEVLVAELRETFGAQGRDRSRGGARGWGNGNLHAYAEPTETGYRFRVGTLKGDAVPTNLLGLSILLTAVVVLAISLVTGDPADDLAVLLLLTAMGASALGFNALRLPRWATEREAQMEHIAARAQALIRPAPEPPAAADDRDR